MQINATPYIVDLTSTEAVPKQGATSRTAHADPRARQRSADRVDLSTEGLNVDQLKKDLAALPEVRLDRVALARQTLQDGGYRLDSKVLAEKMMQAFAA